MVQNGTHSNGVNIDITKHHDEPLQNERKTILVGIAGGTASGKTTVADEIFEKVRVGNYKQCTLIPVDCFYKECTPEQMDDIGNVNFDHPSMFDWELLRVTLEKLQRGEDVTIPDYNYVTCKRNQPGLFRKWSPLVILEGIFGLYDQLINDLFDLKIFVHTDDDIRLARRLQRDIVERQRTVQGVLKSYHRFVKPAHTEFVRPTMKYADIIIPRGRSEATLEKNNIGVNFIVHNLEHHLVKAGYEIVVPASALLEMVEIQEMTSTIKMFSEMVKPIETKMIVVADEENDEEWRSVLASLYDHSSIMGKILVKHICDTLLTRLQQEVDVSMEPGVWDFPQLRGQDKVMLESTQVQCTFSLQMVNMGDQSVIDALQLVETTRVAHRVFVSCFMSHEAIAQIVEAYELANDSEQQKDQKLTFISLYFGSQQVNPDGLIGDDSIQMKRENSILLSPKVNLSNKTRLHGLTQKLIEDTTFAMSPFKIFKQRLQEGN